MGAKVENQLSVSSELLKTQEWAVPGDARGGRGRFRSCQTPSLLLRTLCWAWAAQSWHLPWLGCLLSEYVKLSASEPVQLVAGTLICLLPVPQNTNVWG